MTELIVFPDVEQLLCDWLAPELAARGHAVPVGARVPNPRPNEFVRVLLTGGFRNNLVQDAPRIAYEAWSQRQTVAVGRAQLIRALLHSLRGQFLGDTFVYRVDDLGAPANNPDPDSGHIRYTGAVSILLRGHAQ